MRWLKISIENRDRDEKNYFSICYSGFIFVCPRFAYTFVEKQCDYECGVKFLRKIN